MEIPVQYVEIYVRLMAHSLRPKARTSFKTLFLVRTHNNET